MKPRIVILDGHTLNPGDISWEPVDQLGLCTYYDRSSPDEVLQRSLDADILVINKVRLDRTLIEQLPSLKFVAVTATGFNNIDTECLREMGIPASNVRNYGSSTVAQHTFALILELANAVGLHSSFVRQGAWSRQHDFSFWKQPIIELENKTIGIIGMGNIGTRVARIAQGFGMHVLGTSSHAFDPSLGEQTGLEDLLPQSDFVSLHTHLSKEKEGMVNIEFLSRMKDTAFLINTSRGGLIHEMDLYTALKHNMIAGAGLDVLSTEPPREDHPLIGLPNCIVTPHNAWASVEARQRMMRMTAENITAFLSGNVLNPIS